MAQHTTLVNYRAKVGSRKRGPKRGMVGELAALTGLSTSHISNVNAGRTSSLVVEKLIEDWKAGKLKAAKGA